MSVFASNQYSHAWTGVSEKDILNNNDDGTSNEDNKEEQKSKNEQNDDDYSPSLPPDNGDEKEGSKQKVAILVIGNTGTGKSSITKLLTGHDTTISHSSERGSSTNTTLQSKYDKNIYFIDTVGLQDQNVSWEDPKLLKNTLKYLHHEKLYRVKIIFCVAGDTDTRKGLFAQISTFIGSLRVEEEPGNIKTKTETIVSNITDDGMDDEKKSDNIDTNNIWDSVLVIKKGDKKGIDIEDLDDFSGIWASAMDYGANKSFKSDKHIFAYSCTDWNPKIKQGKVYKRCDEDEYEEYGFYTEARVKEVMDEKLNSLSTFTLQFQHKACENCGSRGDPRYIIATCHTKSEYMHSKPLSSKHPGEEIRIHSGVLVDVEFATGNKRHIGRKLCKHSGTSSIREHPGKLQSGLVKRLAVGLFTLSTSEWLWWKSSEWEWYTCCNEYSGNAGAGCIAKWSCCYERSGNKQCSNYMNKRWSCCNKGWVSEGCKDITTTGKVYNCCNNENGSEGCETIYNCCKKAGDGCVNYYPCCNQGPKGTGCSLKCRNCRTDWGTGPGCVQTSN